MANTARAADGAFTHPGLLTSKTEVEFIKAKIKANEKPWADGWALLTKEKDAFLSHKPSPHAEYDSNPHWSEPGPARDLLDDARAVYGNTLLFVLGDDPRHAKKAEEIIDAWCDMHIRRLEPGKVSDPLLFTSYSWPQVVWSAELLRAYDKTWAKEKQDRFAAFLTKEVVPVVWQKSPWMNNWQSWAVCCRMACAVYLDDRAKFDEAVTQCKEQIARYVKPDGLCGETGRDLWHSQMGMASLLLACEFAWKQGIDLYAHEDNRLLKGVERHIPFVEGDKTDFPKGMRYDLSRQKDGQIWWNMYELAYNHYHNRLGLQTPNTERVVMKRRPEPYWRVGWGSLTHAGAARQAKPAAP